jgi:hypothetical protein
MVHEGGAAAGHTWMKQRAGQMGDRRVSRPSNWRNRLDRYWEGIRVSGVEGW